MLRDDYLSGATSFLERAMDVVASSPDPVAAADEVRRMRRGMAALDLLYLAVSRAGREGLEALRAYAARAREALDAAIAAFPAPARVATVSFSRAVARFLQLKREEVEVVYLLESRPGVEAAEALRAYVGRVVPIPDSAAAAFDYDLALVGLDGYYLDAAVNKVGTFPLLATARERGIPTAAVFESYKAVPLPAPRPHVVRAEVLGRQVEVPLFDVFPHRLLGRLITDVGVVERLDPWVAVRALKLI